MNDGARGHEEDQGLVVWIDGSNLRGGGGVTHLAQLLEHADPAADGFRRIEVWSNTGTLSTLPNRSWLGKHTAPQINGGIVRRATWQQVLLPRLIRTADCDVLLAPGGTVPRWVDVPTVTMFRNSLPFSPAEVRRYSRLSASRLRLGLLRRLQASSMERADGVVFLSGFARQLGSSWFRPKRSVEIPHGVDSRFQMAPRPQRPLSDYSYHATPFRFLYVSHIDLYKHQWAVAEAVGLLREEGLPVAVDFVGGAGNRLAQKKLEATIKQWDPQGRFVNYRGHVSFAELHREYRNADAFVFASSCENLPNTLIEAMSSGLPIACSQMGPMPDVLHDGGIYFDPDAPTSIAEALRTVATKHELRSALAQRAVDLSTRYSWRACSRDTFRFLRTVSRLESEKRREHLR